MKFKKNEINPEKYPDSQILQSSAWNDGNYIFKIFFANLWLLLIEKNECRKFLPLFTTFYDVSVSCSRFSKAKMRQFDASGTEGLRPTVAWM